MYYLIMALHISISHRRISSCAFLACMRMAFFCSAANFVGNQPQSALRRFYAVPSPHPAPRHSFPFNLPPRSRVVQCYLQDISYVAKTIRGREESIEFKGVLLAMQRAGIKEGS